MTSHLGFSRAETRLQHDHTEQGETWARPRSVCSNSRLQADCAGPLNTFIKTICMTMVSFKGESQNKSLIQKRVINPVEIDKSGPDVKITVNLQ